jgi:hypothetical protein
VLVLKKKKERKGKNKGKKKERQTERKEGRKKISFRKHRFGQVLKWNIT